MFAVLIQPVLLAHLQLYHNPDRDRTFDQSLPYWIPIKFQNLDSPCDMWPGRITVL